MSDVPQDCFAEEDNLTDAEREVERWAAAVQMWGDREIPQGPWWHEQATVYDHERNQWSPQCPYGDVCTGCDAAGKCARAPVKAQLPDDGAAWRSSWRWPDGSTRYA